LPIAAARHSRVALTFAATIVLCAARNAALSTAGRAIVMLWPSDSQSFAAFSAAWRHSGSTGRPFQGSTHSAMPSGGGGRPTSARNGPAGGGGQ
jgi:hypothetical protein